MSQAELFNEDNFIPEPLPERKSAKTVLGFQVDPVLEKRLWESAWRNRVSLSGLIRRYCENGLITDEAMQGFEP